MIKRPYTTRRIVEFRWVRPVFDLALLLGALSALLYLHNMEFERQINQKPNMRIHQKAEPGNTLFIENAFDTEAELWQNWSTWIHTHRPGSGQCLMETRPNLIEKPFYLLCFGKQSAGKHSGGSIDPTLFDKNIFVAPSKASTKQAEKPRTTTSEPTHTVQGWIITKQGQKTFDPSQKKWLP